MVRVLFFAQAAHLAGTHACEWHATTPTNAEAFWQWMLQLHPSLASIRSSCRLARNGEYLHEGEAILAEDELAVIPPVSGG